ncbi:hypothetical protein MKW92_045747 [Papaver armeniacum]|nr:hypothetical protein MKW92_045747 [Papaver armeniacum]
MASADHSNLGYEAERMMEAGFHTLHMDINNWRELIQKIKSKGMRPAVALKAGTPVEEVFPLVEDGYPVEMVLIMTTEHGFVKGQSFRPKMLDKLPCFFVYSCVILCMQVDGCVGLCNIKEVVVAGANCIVSGAALLSTDKPREILACYKTLVIEEIERLNWLAENCS